MTAHGAGLDTHDAPSVDARLESVVRSLALEEPAELTDDLHLVADLGYDSLGLLELMTALEDEFSIVELPEDEALSAETIGDLRQLLTLAGVQ